MKLITKLVSLVMAAAVGLFSFVVAFGRQPRGGRLERIKNSPNYVDGSFRNQEQADDPAQAPPKSNSSLFNTIQNFLFANAAEVRPSKPLPAVKTDLWQLDRGQDVLLWMGHDALFIQIDGIRLLVDPTLVMGSPLSFVKTAFPATYSYTPDDIPDIDFLLISHEHWDHLDYHTFNRLRDRIGKVVCGLGVGEYFEYWKFPKDRIIELDWYEQVAFGGLTIHALPARHGTNRALISNKTLWVSFMLEAPTMNIYISGDTGYGVHFPEIGRNFPDIDLAILENGQYDEQWRYSHLLPDQLVRAIKDLNPARVFTVHHAKYDLANHTWRAPLENISAAAARESFDLLTPMMGELVYLKDMTQTFSQWWVD